MHRRTVRQGHRQPGRLPGRIEDRDGHDRNARSAAGLARPATSTSASPAADPESGNEYRSSSTPRRPLRRVGAPGRSVSANATTGRLTTTVLENPQVPFSDLILKLDGGPQRRWPTRSCAARPRPTPCFTPYSGGPAAEPLMPFPSTSTAKAALSLAAAVLTQPRAPRASPRPAARATASPSASPAKKASSTSHKLTPSCPRVWSARSPGHALRRTAGQRGHMPAGQRDRHRDSHRSARAAAAHTLGSRPI